MHRSLLLMLPETGPRTTSNGGDTQSERVVSPQDVLEWIERKMVGDLAHDDERDQADVRNPFQHRLEWDAERWQNPWLTFFPVGMLGCRNRSEHWRDAVTSSLCKRSARGERIDESDSLDFAAILKILGVDNCYSVLNGC